MINSFILDKLRSANFKERPFKHLVIEDFLPFDFFQSIVDDPVIRTASFRNSRDLINGLNATGYEVIRFPGTVDSIESYLQEPSLEGAVPRKNTCEGAGIALRWKANRSVSTLVTQLLKALTSHEFTSLLCDKFEIDMSGTFLDYGIHKYLSGYEISPHPDIRQKRLTMMLNLNPDPTSEGKGYHTQLMRFKPRYRYIETFWDQNVNAERAWVPWDWCETVTQVSKNNTIVIFSPSNTSLHAVKARYDHLTFQRTQFYANLWATHPPETRLVEWESLEIPFGEIAPMVKHVAFKP